MKNYCYNCMNEIGNKEYCTKCLKDNSEKAPAHHLLPGTKLNNRYLVGYAIGEGGFGITYIGLDTTLDIKVAIKEFFPNGYVNRNHENSSDISTSTQKQKDFFTKGKDRFLMEARSIAKFSQEKGIVDVRDYFEENATAYIIMEYLDGMTLSQHCRQNGNINATKLFTLMLPIMKSLEKMHNTGVVHRDISPDNIMYMLNGELKLMDFGSARYFTNEEKLMSVMLKQGYAPEEQYRKNGKQGPWTDVYGMCATMYRCITGKIPDDALDRLYEDKLKSPLQLGVIIDSELNRILMYGLNVHHSKRCKDMGEMMSLTERALGKKQKVKRDYNAPVVFEKDEKIEKDEYKTEFADEKEDALFSKKSSNNNQPKYINGSYSLNKEQVKNRQSISTPFISETPPAQKTPVSKPAYSAPVQAKPAPKQQSKKKQKFTLIDFFVILIILSVVFIFLYQPISTIFESVKPKKINPEYTAIFSENDVYDYAPLNFNCENYDAYVKESYDETIRKVEYGYEGDVIYEMVDTIYYYIEDLSEEQIDNLDQKNRDNFSAAEDLYYCNIMYRTTSSYYIVTLEMSNMNDTFTLESFDNAGLLTYSGNGTLSPKKQEKLLLNEGFIKKYE